MKSALIAALVAAVVAGGSAAAATTINGRSIRPHSIPLNRLTKIPHVSATSTTTTSETFTRVLSDPAQINPGQQFEAIAACPIGQQVVGGGYSLTPTTATPHVVSTYPTSNASWYVGVYNTTSVVVDVQAYAICVSP